MGSNKTIKLKFKDQISLRLEYKLINTYGFTFFARKNGEWVMYRKELGLGKRVDTSGLPEDVVTDLTRKVNKIAGAFAEPEANKDVIKMRCTNMARTLLPKQRQWVLDWIKRVIDEEEDDSAPWNDSCVTTTKQEVC